MSKTDIIIPVWNQLEHTKGCVESIMAYSKEAEYRIILVDNASGIETCEYIDGLADKHKGRIIVIRNNINLGFIKAVNRGIRFSVESGWGDYLCILNNDTIVHDGWLPGMTGILERNTDIGIINPSSNTLGQSKAPYDIDPNVEEYTEMPRCTGFCMVFAKELVGKIGCFDEVFGMGNFEDMDFSMKAKKIGFKCVRSNRAFVYHAEGRSFRLFDKKDHEFERNKKIFEERYGKPKRILYFLSQIPSSIKEFEEKVRVLSLDGNWVWVLSPRVSKGNFFSKEYPQVKLIRGNRLYLILTGCYKAIFKKKAFSDVYVYSNKFFYQLVRVLNVRKINIAMVTL